MEFSLNYAQFNERSNLMTQMDSSVPSSETRDSNWKIKTAELGSDHPCIAGRSNQAILKEINPEYSLEEAKLQYFGHLI